MNWETVVGLEVHVQLKTRSKIFCPCPTSFGAPPNTHTCPVCLGLPGALPVLNREAVRLATRAALALGFSVDQDVSTFARKHYFYPDLPKGYQISQFEQPLASGGRLEIPSPERGPVSIGIGRLHLEEDAGKSFHGREGVTELDFNRAGVPLIEIVSEPDLRSPEEARIYLGTLKRLLEYVEVSDCSMEEGSLRVDANLSVRRPGEPLGTKQEIKNLNSFAAVERALSQLRDRQTGQMARREAIELTTFSAGSGELRPMRSKEESHDYRYFPDPDLNPLSLSAAGIQPVTERQGLPELPAAKRSRFLSDYQLPVYDVEALIGTRALADYYEAVVHNGCPARQAAHWVLGPMLADANEHGGRHRVLPARLASLVRLVEEGVVSNQAAKRVLAVLADQDGDPGEIAERLGLVQVGESAEMTDWVEATIRRHAAEVRRYTEGETRLLAFLIGAVMKESRGRADPRRAQAQLETVIARLG